ncbi:MAG: isopentenyl phosphate kinase [Candidatus Paceibacterota bacterium]
MEPIIIKIAGSVITDQKFGKPIMNWLHLRTIADELKNYKAPYILIHGAGSYGHPLAKKTGIDKSVISNAQLLAFAKTQKMQNELDCLICAALIKKGIPAFPAQASSHAVLERGRLVKMETEAIAGLIRLKLVPVSYGVPAFDNSWGSAILSSDQIAPYLAKHLGIKKIIEISDVDGIYTADPKINKGAELIRNIGKSNFEKIDQYLFNNPATTDVTGGIKQKYIELISAAKNGAIVQIIHFKNLKNALEGKNVGTIIDLSH